MIEEKEIEDIKEKRKEAERKAFEEPSTSYVVARFIELLCIGAFVFGFLWNGTEVMNLTTPQFMMLYGGSGAVISEVTARIIKKKQSIR
jgi:hypothetical protein